MDFGNNNAEFVIISLIVSDGDESRNNRDLLLNPELKKVGFSKAKHLTYDYLTIITLCSDFKNTFDKDDNEDYDGLLRTKSKEPSKTTLSQASTKIGSSEEHLNSSEKIKNRTEVLINEPDIVSYEIRERLVIERGNRKKKIILMKKYKDGHKKKEVRYIPI